MYFSYNCSTIVPLYIYLKEYKMTYSLYFKKDNKDNKYGHIYIMKIENRIKSYRSLKIKIPTNLWNEKHKQVRVTDKLDYISINKQIKSEIENCTKNISIKKNTDSFISFFEQYNTTIANEGSKEKYKQVLAKLKKVYSELLFCDFNYSVVLNLNKVFRETLTVNTSNHYLKQIKKILDFAIKLDIINYLRHPFLGFEFKNEKVGNDSLNIQEVQAIINIQDNKLA
ncbi:MAG: hypothetical protein RLZZ175_1985, partial [Bacteroidota bacterium]